MRKVLFVLPNLEYSGAAKQVVLLAGGLPRDQFAVRVCALGREGPVSEQLHAAGVPIHVLGSTRLVNLAAFWQWRRLVQTLQPDVIHTWGSSALRTVLLAGRGRSRLYASSPLLPRAKRAYLGRFERWLLGRADQVIAQGPAEGQRWQRLGLPADKTRIIPPGVRPGDAAFATSSPGLPVPASPCRLVVCAGPLEPHKGFGEAIWAFDILQFLYEDVRLLVIGTGSQKERLRQFAEATGASQRVHFLGQRSDLPQLLAQAEIVWVPSLAEGGYNVALEAMALGKAVMASRLPGLAEIVADGQTGLLVTPGSKVEWARRGRLLLDDPALRRRMGERGQRRAAEHFSVADLVRCYTNLYALQMAA